MIVKWYKLMLRQVKPQKLLQNKRNSTGWINSVGIVFIDHYDDWLGCLKQGHHMMFHSLKTLCTTVQVAALLGQVVRQLFNFAAFLSALSDSKSRVAPKSTLLRTSSIDLVSWDQNKRLLASISFSRGLTTSKLRFSQNNFCNSLSSRCFFNTVKLDTLDLSSTLEL